MAQLDDAIKYLDAVDLGDGEHYAWFDAALKRYIVAPASEMHYLGNGAKLTKMPCWWTPKRRFAWRIKGYSRQGVTEVITRLENLSSHPAYRDAYERITADLDTGAEVAA